MIVDTSGSVLALLAKHGVALNSSSLDVAIREPHPSQARVRREMRRFNVADCGRRYGKSFMGTDWALEPAVDPPSFLATASPKVQAFVKSKGVGGLPVAWFAPTFKMLAEVFDEVVKIVGPDNIARKNQQQGRIEFKNGGKMDFWSLEAAPTLRGRFYARVVIDEAAHVTCDLQKVWEKVIRPTLSDLQGEAFFISTPDGYNFFRTLYERGNDPEYPEWMSWMLPTSDNPFIDPKEIALAKEEMDDQSFRQEYLAEFLRDEGKVFRNVDANLKAPVGVTPIVHFGHKMVAGVDWAQVKDFTVNSIGCATCKQEVLLDRFNQIEFHTQRRKLVEQWKKWNVRNAVVEENSIGRPNYEELLRETIVTEDGGICRVRAVKLTSASKPKLVQRLALSLEKVQFQFLPDRVGQNEMLSYEAKVNPNTGNIIYTAPNGAHDDTVVGRFIMLSNIHSGGVARLQPIRLR